MMYRVILPACLAMLVIATRAAHAEDKVEFLNGTNATGKILQIRKADKEFDFVTSIGGKQYERTYPYGKVHAVTFGGKRYELTPLPSPGSAASSGSSQPGSGQPGSSHSGSGQSGSGQSGSSHSGAIDSNRIVPRSSAEVNRLIDQAGNNPPDWFDRTKMDYPDSLDLDWPIKPPPGWNNRKNVGQFIWDVVNPNAGRWHGGIKLVHHCMSLHRGDAKLLKRDMEKLATMYFTLLQDYPRAAFWFKRARVTPGSGNGVRLAECYWRLGNQALARSTMRGRTFHVSAIKLFGDMGEIDLALKVAEAYSKTRINNEANLAAGDAIRKAGRLDEAIAYYQRVLNAGTARNKDYEKRFKARAQGSIEAIRLYDRADVSNVSDGTYSARSTGYNGDLGVEVVVRESKIESVRVTDHNEKQYYAALTDTTDQIIRTQGIREIDGTSGATITSQAIVHATAKALAEGAR